MSERKKYSPDQWTPEQAAKAEATISRPPPDMSPENLQGLKDAFAQYSAPAAPGSQVSPEMEEASAYSGIESELQPWSGPEQIPLEQETSAGEPKWGTAADPNATLEDRVHETVRDAAYSGAGGVLSGIGVNPKYLGPDVAASLDMARERSPTAAPLAQIAGEVALPMVAAGPAAMARAPIATGAVTGGLSTAGNTDPATSKAELAKRVLMGAGAGGAVSAAAPLVTKPVIGAARGAANKLLEIGKGTVDAGKIQRVGAAGTYGGEMNRLRAQIGKQGVIDFGGEIEGRGLHKGKGLLGGLPQPMQTYADNAEALLKEGTARQIAIRDAAKNAGVTVPVAPLEQNLRQQAYDASGSANPANRAHVPFLKREADTMVDATRNRPGYKQEGPTSAPTGELPFEQAFKERQGYDDLVNWRALGGPAEDSLKDATRRELAHGYRGSLVDSLEKQAPELRPQWEKTQKDLQVALGVKEPALRREFQEAGNQTISLPALIGGGAGAAAFGPAGLLAVPAMGVVKSRLKSALAGGLGGIGRAEQAVGGALGAGASKTESAVKTLRGSAAGQAGKSSPETDFVPLQEALDKGGTEDKQAMLRAWLEGNRRQGAK